MNQLRELTGNAREFVRALGAAVLFLLRILEQVPRAARRPRLIIEQVYNAGALSLVIIMICGMFIGMVIGLQFYDVLQRFGADRGLGWCGPRC